MLNIGWQRNDFHRWANGTHVLELAQGHRLHPLLMIIVNIQGWPVLKLRDCSMEWLFPGKASLFKGEILVSSYNKFQLIHYTPDNIIVIHIFKMFFVYLNTSCVLKYIYLYLYVWIWTSTQTKGHFALHIQGNTYFKTSYYRYSVHLVYQWVPLSQESHPIPLQHFVL